MTSKRKNTPKAKRTGLTRKVVRKPRFKFWTKLNTWKFLLPLILLTFAAFYPSLENGFVNWDDDRNFYENQNVVDVNKDNIGGQLVKIFQSGVIGNYNPLPIASFVHMNAGCK